MSSPAPPPESSAGDWIVVTCPHCSQPMKIRAGAGAAAARLLCPSCHTLLSLRPRNPPGDPPAAHQADPSPPPELSERPPPDQPPPTRPHAPQPPLISQGNPDAEQSRLADTPLTQLAVDHLARSEFRTFDDPAFAIPEKGIRVRKRKRRSHQAHKEIHPPEWDADAEAGTNEPAPPTDQATAGWQELTTATVAVEVRDDGSVIQRRKRFRKKRLPTSVEKAFRGLGRAARVTLVASSALIILGAIVGGIYLARSRDEAPAAPSYPVEIEGRVFARADEAAIAETVSRQFLAADGVEAKLAFVRFPDKVRPLMDEWYLTHSAAPVDCTRPTELEPLMKLVNADGLRFVVIALQLIPDQEIRFFAVQQTPGGTGKLDWEVSVGYQLMPLDSFKAQRPESPVPFRALVRPGDYYNGVFADADRWYCCELTYPGERSFRIFGYLDRNTPEGARAAGRLDTESFSCILSLACPPGSSDPNQAAITRIIRDQWFLPDGPVTAAMAR